LKSADESAHSKEKAGSGFALRELPMIVADLSSVQANAMPKLRSRISSAEPGRLLHVITAAIFAFGARVERY